MWHQQGKVKTLNPGEELRIAVEPSPSKAYGSNPSKNDEVSITLLTGGHPMRGNLPAVGTAEIFGAELVPGVPFIADPGRRFAVYSWGGCSIEVHGSGVNVYEAPSPAMHSYLNITDILRQTRQNAMKSDQIGPRVLVIGNSSSGKSSVCEILVNYAVRGGFMPTFIELDPRGACDKPALGFLPSTIGATTVCHTDEIEPIDPLVFTVGQLDPQDNINVFSHYLKLLAMGIYLRFYEPPYLDTESPYSNEFTNDQTKGVDNNPETKKLLKASGFIINSPHQPSIDLIQCIIDFYGVDTVLIIDNPAMKHSLMHKYKSDPSKEYIKWILIPKLDGVYPVEVERLKWLAGNLWTRYFFGTPNAPISESSVRVKWSQLDPVTIDHSTNVEGSASESVDSNRIVCTRWAGSPFSLIQCTLAILNANDLVGALYATTLCFAHVVLVEPLVSPNVQADFIVDLLLPPMSTRLPSNILRIPTIPSQMRINLPRNH